jgi:DNA-directed RNA polymerase specialized sigma24 family protein
MTILRRRFIDAWRRKKATQSFDDELHSNSDSEEADVLAGVLRKEFDDWQLQMRPKLRAVVMALPPERKELYFASLVDDLPPQGVVQKLIYRDGALHDRDKVDDQIRRLVRSIENQLGQLQPKG